MELKEELEATIKPLTDKVKELEGKLEEYKAKEITRKVPASDTEVKVVKDAGDQPFESLGQQLIAVKDFEVSRGRISDPRLKAPAGLSEGQPSEGGFLVQTDFATNLLEKVFAASDIVSRVTRFPVSSGANARKIPAVSDANRANGSRSGGIQAYWAAEAGTKTPSQPAFDQISLELKKLVGLCYVTDELLEDAPFLESWISQAFTKEFDFKIADAIVNGDGAGKPLGILEAPCLLSITAETSQAADTILFENIKKMWAARFAPNAMNYVWLINQNIEPQLYGMSMAVGTGGVPVYMPAGGISGAPYGSLMGRPVIPCEQAASIGDVGDIILADLSQYVMIDKGSIKAASSIHVYFTTDQTGFRFTYRCDGQPWWKTYITPYKGTTSYQSCFVTLAAR